MSSGLTADGKACQSPWQAALNHPEFGDELIQPILVWLEAASPSARTKREREASCALAERAKVAMFGICTRKRHR